MHHTTHLRSRRFFVAVAVSLAALLMVGVSTAVKSAHSATPQTEAAAATTATNHAFSGSTTQASPCPRAWATWSR
jgi:FlaG/FlaF family flagellin (archaellin)